MEAHGTDSGTPIKPVVISACGELPTPGGSGGEPSAKRTAVETSGGGDAEEEEEEMTPAKKRKMELLKKMGWGAKK